ncbi:Uncharacterised protein [Legionella bozemanae]|uniref:Uncharacterized protein n=1 Tax=Legionella bozemanae TaxID=447 RepID=A0A0W0RRG6_LEGBO|nr:hypothetical protein Lboz_2299 [Legionella bozemanae]STO33478.1 Uncharacterised protein [Legionella bozemanae]
MGKVRNLFAIALGSYTELATTLYEEQFEKAKKSGTKAHLSSFADTQVSNLSPAYKIFNSSVNIQRPILVTHDSMGN